MLHILSFSFSFSTFPPFLRQLLLRRNKRDRFETSTQDCEWSQFLSQHFCGGNLTPGHKIGPIKHKVERATPICRKNGAVSLQLQRRYARRGTSGRGREWQTIAAAASQFLLRLWHCARYVFRVIIFLFAGKNSTNDQGSCDRKKPLSHWVSLCPQVFRRHNVVKRGIFYATVCPSVRLSHSWVTRNLA